MMSGIILLAASIICCLPLIIIITDGRYFGKIMMRWIYDNIGPVVYSVQSEEREWHNFIQRLNFHGYEKVLDIGSAVGDLAIALAAEKRFYGQVVGIDWSQKMVELAEGKAELCVRGKCCEFRVVDIRDNLPFESNVFDVIFCFGVLESFSKPEQIFEELKRILTADGSIIVSYIVKPSIINGGLSYAWYRSHLAALGMTDLQIIPCRRNQDAIIARSSKFQT